MDILQSQMLTSFRAHSQTDEACFVSNDFSSVRFNRPSPLSSVFTMEQMSIEKARRNSRGGECRDGDAFSVARASAKAKVELFICPFRLSQVTHTAYTI